MIWLNAGLFQATWFATVLGGPLWGAPVLALLLWQACVAGSPRAELLIVAGLGAGGWMLDSLWNVTGVLDYGTILAPEWIVMLWCGVALTLNHSLSAFHARPLIGALLAACAAPISYLAGARLGRVEIPELTALAWVSLAWLPLFYGLFRILGNRVVPASAEDSMRELGGEL